MEVQYDEPEPDFFSIISQDADSSCMSLAPDYSEAPIREARGYTKLSREDKRRQRRASEKYRMAHATRERLRVEVRLTVPPLFTTLLQAFNNAFCTLRTLLPTLPPDKKLSKIEILRLSFCYISYLNSVLDSKY